MSFERDELLIAEHRGEVLFNSSPIRTNILSWMDFPKGASVLEIDPEAEVITSFLKEKGLEVFSSSASRLDEVSDKFDYVISIGVIDKDIVDNAFRILKEGGQLIIAIANRNGLMYQAGVPNFYTKQSFGSWRGGDGNHSISKYDLQAILASVSFENIDWYYPMPDYRLASEIYSDEYLPKAGAMTRPTPSYDGDYIIEIDEVEAFNKSVEEGTFTETANSFLVVCEK